MFTVDWKTRIVTVPRSSLTLVTLDPEIYTLDVVDFWREIHDIQDDIGMPYDSIMRSNPPVTLSGTTDVRVVEVINGYRVEFENGNYLITLSGGRSNLLDVRIGNNVSINNPAGILVGTALTPEEADCLAEIKALARHNRDLLEADEELTPLSATKFKRGTSQKLIPTKGVDGGQLVQTINIREG